VNCQLPLSFFFTGDKEGNKVGNKTDDIISILHELCSYKEEREWFEFKENWFESV